MPYDTLRRPTTPAIPAHDDPSLPYYTLLPLPTPAHDGPRLPYHTLLYLPTPLYPTIPYYTCLPRHPHSYHPCTPSILLDLLDPLDLLLLFALDLAVS